MEQFRLTVAECVVQACRAVDWLFVKPWLFVNGEDFLATFVNLTSTMSVALIYSLTNDQRGATLLRPAPEMACNVGKAMLYMYFFTITHETGNQCNEENIKEDMINKPYRPICSAKISQSDARRLSYLCTVLFAATSYCMFPAHTFEGKHTFACGLLWCALTLVHNHWTNWYRDYWFCKDGYFGIGAYSVLVPGWYVVNKQIPASIHLLMLYHCFLAFFTIQIQDFRDFRGDVLAGRFTMPIRYGMDNIRIFSCFVWGIDLIRNMFRSAMLCTTGRYYHILLVFAEVVMIALLLLPVLPQQWQFWGAGTVWQRCGLEKYDHYLYVYYLCLLVAVLLSYATVCS